MKKIYHAIGLKLMYISRPFVYVHEYTHLVVALILGIKTNGIVFFEKRDYGEESYLRIEHDKDIQNKSTNQQALYCLKLAIVSLCPFLLTYFVWILYTLGVRVPICFLIMLHGFFPSKSDIENGFKMLFAVFLILFTKNNIEFFVE